MPIEVVKRNLDAMAAVKFNVPLIDAVPEYVNVGTETFIVTLAGRTKFVKSPTGTFAAATVKSPPAAKPVPGLVPNVD